MHDVAIIGGGPAGSTAASLLAAHGRKVVLFEKERFPRFHIGESLLPFNSDLFRRLGVFDELEGRFLEKWGARLFSSDGATSRYIEFADATIGGYPYAFHVLRSEFDQLLLESARKRGAEVHEGATVVEARASYREGCEVTVQDAGGQISRYGARFLLDASGRDAFVASRRRLRKMTPHLRKAAVFAHYEGVPRAEGKFAGDIVLVVLKDGWFWIIPLPEGRTSMGLVLGGTSLKNAGMSPEKLLEEASRRCPAVWEKMKDAQRVSQVYTASDYSYECDEVAGDGYLLLGDAAAFIDPIFSTGVWLAMSSGEMAADTLHAAFDDPRGPTALAPRAFRGYARRVRHHVRTYTRIVTRFYQPGFMDVFLQPSARYGLKEAVICLLAGCSEPPPAVRWRLNVFYLITRLQKRFPLSRRVPLLKVLEEASR